MRLFHKPVFVFLLLISLPCSFVPSALLGGETSVIRLDKNGKIIRLKKGTSEKSPGESSVMSTVAVLDLASPADSPWVGAAIAESLAARLGNVENIRLVERENIALLIHASGEDTTKPSLMGADYVVTGSVQLAGAWEDTSGKIRISVKLIAAESATIQGNAALVQDGELKNLFTLETTLAESLAKAMGKEASASALSYCEERNLLARKFFGEGLTLLRKVAALPGTEVFFREENALLAIPSTTAFDSRTASSSITDEVRSKASDLLEKAITTFRSAQTENMGEFFSRAHSYEGRSREWLARVQADTAKAKEVRNATVTQFRQDAADAAPAFFNLGRALQENGQYEDAIKAYDEYLQWMDEKNKRTVWERKEKVNTLSFWMSGIPGMYPVQYTGNNMLVSGKRLFYMEGEKKKGVSALVCLDTDTGAVLWKNSEIASQLHPDADTNKTAFFHKDARYGYQYLLNTTPSYLLVLYGDHLLVLNQNDGNLMRTITLPALYTEDSVSSFSMPILRADTVPDSDSYVLLQRSADVNKAVGLIWIGAADLATGELLWEKTFSIKGNRKSFNKGSILSFQYRLLGDYVIPFHRNCNKFRPASNEEGILYNEMSKVRSWKTGEPVEFSVHEPLRRPIARYQILSSLAERETIYLIEYTKASDTIPEKLRLKRKGDAWEAQKSNIPFVYCECARFGKGGVIFPEGIDPVEYTATRNDYLFWDHSSCRLQVVNLPPILGQKIGTLDCLFTRKRYASASRIEKETNAAERIELVGNVLMIYENSTNIASRIYSIEGQHLGDGAGVPPLYEGNCLISPKSKRKAFTNVTNNAFTEDQAHYQRAKCFCHLNNCKLAFREARKCTHESILQKRSLLQVYRAQGKNTEIASTLYELSELYPPRSHEAKSCLEESRKTYRYEYVLDEYLPAPGCDYTAKVQEPSYAETGDIIRIHGVLFDLQARKWITKTTESEKIYQHYKAYKDWVNSTKLKQVNKKNAFVSKNFSNELAGRRFLFVGNNYWEPPLLLFKFPGAIYFNRQWKQTRFDIPSLFYGATAYFTTENFVIMGEGHSGKCYVVRKDVYLKAIGLDANGDPIPGGRLDKK